MIITFLMNVCGLVGDLHQLVGHPKNSWLQADYLPAPTVASASLSDFSTGGVNPSSSPSVDVEGIPPGVDRDSVIPPTQPTKVSLFVCFTVCGCFPISRLLTVYIRVEPCIIYTLSMCGTCIVLHSTSSLCINRLCCQPLFIRHASKPCPQLLRKGVKRKADTTTPGSYANEMMPVEYNDPDPAPARRESVRQIKKPRRDLPEDLEPPISTMVNSHLLTHAEVN